VGDEGARGIVGWTRGGWSTSVDNELVGEEAAIEEMLALGVAADSSSLQHQHWVEDVEVVLLLGIGSDGQPCSGQRRQTQCQ
jgi:hypothetical protein